MKLRFGQPNTIQRAGDELPAWVPPAWIIPRIEKGRKSPFRQDRAVIELPLQGPEDQPAKPPKSERGIVIIEF